MASRNRGNWQAQQGKVADLLAAEAELDRLDIARWIEATSRSAELPSVVDIAKRNGFVADLARRLNG